MALKSYQEVAAELGLTPFEVYDAEHKAFYKLFLQMLEEFDCDFEALAESLDLPLKVVIKAFLHLYYYHHPDQKPVKKSA